MIVGLQKGAIVTVQVEHGEHIKNSFDTHHFSPLMCALHSSSASLASEARSRTHQDNSRNPAKIKVIITIFELRDAFAIATTHLSLIITMVAHILHQFPIVGGVASASLLQIPLDRRALLRRNASSFQRLLRRSEASLSHAGVLQRATNPWFLTRPVASAGPHVLVQCVVPVNCSRFYGILNMRTESHRHAKFTQLIALVGGS